MVTDSGHANAASAQDEIIDAERKWVELYKNNDADTFATLLTDDFVIRAQLAGRCSAKPNSTTSGTGP